MSFVNETTGFKPADGTGQRRVLVLQLVGVWAVAMVFAVLGSAVLAWSMVAGGWGYFYGVWVGLRGGYGAGYERGQDDTVARFL